MWCSYPVLQHMLCLDSFFLFRSVDEFDIDTTENVIHKHIPLAVLIRIVQDWKRAHNGKLLCVT
jgi:hypothetical protein